MSKFHRHENSVYVVSPRGEMHDAGLVGQVDGISNLDLRKVKSSCSEEVEKCQAKSVIDTGESHENAPFHVYGRMIVCLAEKCPTFPSE